MNPLSRYQPRRSLRTSEARSSHLALWAAAAALLIPVGTLGAVLAASSVARSDDSRARLAFRFSATQAASTLKLAIQHEEDLVVGGRAFVVSNPRTSAASFAKWAESVGALRRYHELQDIGLLVLVGNRELPAFRARMLAHPILHFDRQPAESRGSFDVVPTGNRPYYCLAAAGVVRNPVALLPPGLDYCALEPSLLSARDTAKSSYLPFNEGGVSTLAVQTPIYRTGVAPSTLTARRHAFLGWLAESLVPQVVLQTALAGHPKMAVTFRYRAGGSDVMFKTGAGSAGAERVTIDLHNGWSVESAQSVASGGIFGDAQALMLLLVGTALALLLGALTFVLGTGRTRAMSLVREKTSELSYQAMHDALTDLPNRKLVVQRAEEMLARRGVVTAALYLDLDGFKLINDTFGHAAGDEMLRVVATRLQNAVRAEDIVGRLGGDEFVVLLESPSGDSRPDLVAERLIELSREPVTVAGSDSVVTVSASVGIAVGPRTSVDALLRDADLALYAAKAAGKDRYMLFRPGLEVIGRVADESSSLVAEPHPGT